LNDERKTAPENSQKREHGKSTVIAKVLKMDKTAAMACPRSSGKKYRTGT
jgi:hypothetical protein